MASSPEQEPARCQTRLIADVPVAKDAFGAHEALATLIADMVESEVGGKSIGLAGPWGAGKSTVVRLLEERFADVPDRGVWIFDAWAHEGDPLRRSFLESLIDYLTDIDWVRQRYWKKKREELARRRRLERKETTPLLTPAGWVGVVLALLIPVGAVIFDHGIDSGATVSIGAPPHWPTVMGLLLMVGPLWAAPIGYLVLNLAGYAKTRGASRSFEWLSWREVLSPFTQQQVTRTRTQVEETPDPTSIEFEECFSDLVGEALRSDDRRLVLVVDNLDRVTPGDALRIWSTLQTFIHPGGGEPGWADRLWVVMPYDPKSIRRLWESDSGSHGGGEESGPVEPATAGSLASAFLDKTFQLRLDVPLPILSDWRDYLYNTLAEALPNHDLDEFHVVYRLVKLLRVQQGQAPTPREIKIIANQIGALHRQHNDLFPLGHLAYYAVLRRSGVDVVADLKKGQIPGESERGLLGDEVEADLAALAYGMSDRQKAFQLLLEVPLLNALQQPDGQQLRELYEHAPGFFGALEETLDGAKKEWPSGEAEKFIVAAQALSQSEVLAEAPSHMARSIRRSLTEGVHDVESWAPLSDWDQPGFAVLLQLLDDELAARNAWSAYTRAVEQSDEPSSKEEAVRRARGLVNTAKAVATRIDLKTAISTPAILPGSLDFFLEGVAEAKDRLSPEEEIYLQVLSHDADSDTIRDYMKERITGGEYRIKHLEAARTLEFHGNIPWNQLLQDIQNKLTAGKAGPPEESHALIQTLLHVRSQAKSHFTALAQNGHFAHLAHVAASKKHWKAAAASLYAQSLAFGDLSPRGGAAQAAQGYQRMQEWLASPPAELSSELAETVIRQADPEPLLALRNDAHAPDGLVGQTIANLLKPERGPDFVDPAFVMDLWRAVPCQQLSTFLNSWQRTGEVAELVQAKGFNVDEAPLYLAILSSEATAPDFVQWLKEGLERLDKKTWEEEPDLAGPLHKLAWALLDDGVQLRLTGQYRMALKTFARQTAQAGKAAPEGARNPAGLLDEAEREIFRDELVDLVLERDAQVHTRFFDVFGRELTESHKLRNNNDVIHKFLEPAVREIHTAALNWIKAAVEADPEIFSDLSEKRMRVFRRAVAEELAESDEGDKAQPVLNDLASLLGIRVASKKARPNHSDSSEEQ